MRDGRRHIGQASVWRMPSGPECSQLEGQDKVGLVTPGGYGILSMIIYNVQYLLYFCMSCIGLHTFCQVDISRGA